MDKKQKRELQQKISKTESQNLLLHKTWETNDIPILNSSKHSIFYFPYISSAKIKHLLYLQEKNSWTLKRKYLVMEKGWL